MGAAEPALTNREAASSVWVGVRVRLVPALAVAVAALAAACSRGAPAPSGPDAVVPPESSIPESAPGAFRRLPPPRPGDWRSRFPDDVPMSFEAYVDDDPVRAEPGKDVVAFLPVGPFTDAERATLAAAAEFCGLWFGLPSRVLPDEKLTESDAWTRTNGSVRQWRTGWFLERLLPPRRPEDSVVLLGVTMADLYPGPSWNYVFGEANLRRRVGVYSLVRYFPEFWGQAVTEDTARTALLRTLKVVVHETGHTFGLEHCVTWECAMNGSNSLAETDASPLLLCPDCLRKLAWNRGFDVRARYGRLADWLEAHGLAAEAAWHRARAAAAR